MIPDLCRFEVQEIEMSDDGCVQITPGPAKAEVAVDVDPQRVRDHLMEVWLAG